MSSSVIKIGIAFSERGGDSETSDPVECCIFQWMTECSIGGGDKHHFQNPIQSLFNET